MGFKVQRKMCATCIYRPDSPLDLKELERQVADRFGGFKGHRICHHSKDACCAGFWSKHKDRFAAGQIAQRLSLVEFVNVDTLASSNSREKGVRHAARNGERKDRDRSSSRKRTSS